MKTSELSKAMLRVRVSSHDGHYAGGLVDGAKLLQLFGDVATELLIKFDGDEGLFRAYDNVEFLAPVFAGDYIEATGRIVKAGKTSRTMEFEAKKVISLLPHERGGKGASSAEVLAVPTIVCRAKGTCVTPLGLQRFDRSK
ncbi:MAG: hotdog domain-containing protein [Candidatus Poribacteria bacterium]